MLTTSLIMYPICHSMWLTTTSSIYIDPTVFNHKFSTGKYTELKIEVHFITVSWHMHTSDLGDPVM